MNRSIRLAAVALLAAIPACSTPPQGTGVEHVQRVREDEAFLGSWRSAAGRSLRVTSAADARYRLSLAAGGQTSVYSASLLRVEEYLVAEVLLNRDEMERATDANNIPPVYLYTLLDLADNLFTSLPLRADWVSLHAEPAGIRAADVPAQALATAASGRLVVASSDRARMYELLRTAVRDPDAWGPPELFVRAGD
ncbi:MAG: hypothetical protein FJ255_08975 [Phycisphaerae bacterium]|nr:hypothetical protein [Phycisphaerae bacterium]